MEKFTHYLITRFNVPFSGPAPEFFSGARLSAEWLKERIQLFTDFCVPSVAGQTNQAFTWLIYLDSETDRTDIIRIRAAIPAKVRVEFRYVADYNDLLEDLRAYVKASGTEFIITSRLDNDDALGTEYIERVQAAFVPDNGVLLNFLGGIYYDPVREVAAHHRFKLNNSFTSLIERNDPRVPPVTVLGFPHLYPPPEIQVRNLAYPYAFWINLHGGNEGNRRVHGRPVWSRRICRHYGFARERVSFSLPAMVAYLFRWGPRALVRKIAFKIRTGRHG